MFECLNQANRRDRSLRLKSFRASISLSTGDNAASLAPLTKIGKLMVIHRAKFSRNFV